ncbi:hypothetical protein [Deinococcus marmoris]|uniref:hypothetical protein n=1 Tax=Deinococcus marmoris TaxID=249408 RepID=UPI0011154621|nr:hypothetical protein [Deinococcus marmoris]
MGGNRKHGFARGNASGRNGQTYGPKWFCDGCQREHGGKVFSTVIYGLVYCGKQAGRIETARSERRLSARIAFASAPEQVDSN